MKRRRRPRVFLTSSGLQNPEHGGRRPQIVIARALTRFVSLPLPAGLGRRRAAAALRLQMLHTSPYAQTAGYAVLGTRRVALWFWDQAQVHAVVRQAGFDPEALRYLPESELVPPQPGARLLALSEGYEGRVEDGAETIGSRWWPAVPSADEWRLFCLDHDLAASAVPAPQRTAPTDEPRAANALEAADSWRRWLDERVVYTALAVALALPAGWWLGQWARLAWVAQEQSARSEALRQQLAPAVEARAAALAAADWIEAVDRLRAYPDPLALLAAIAAALPADSMVVNEVDIRPGTLRAQWQVKPEAVSVSALLRGVEATGHFDDVQATYDAGSRTITLNAKVRRLTGPAPANR